MSTCPGLANHSGGTRTRRNVLVREFIATIRQLGSCEAAGFEHDHDVSGFVDDGTMEHAAVQVAWNQYCKIRESPGARSLIRQVPMSAIALLVSELGFMHGSEKLLWRFERIVEIFSDHEDLGWPIKSVRVFTLYLRALNMLCRHQQVFSEISKFCARMENISISKLPVPILRQIIAAYFGGGRSDQAMKVFYHMVNDKDYQHQLTPHIYEAVLCGALHANNLPSSELRAIVMDLLGLLCQPRYPDNAHIGILNSLLHEAGKCGNSSFQLYVFVQSLSHGVAINHSTLGILLHNACNASVESNELYRVYLAIVANDSARRHMTKQIFATFINSFVMHERPDYALAALQDLRAHPTAKCTARHLESLFGYYSKQGMAQSALELYRSMVEHDKLRPTWKAYYHVVNAIGRSTVPLSPPPLLSAETDYCDNAQSDTQLVSPISGDDLLVKMIRCGRANQIQSMIDAFDELYARFPQDMLVYAALAMQAHRIVLRYVERTNNGDAPILEQPGIHDDLALRKFTHQYYKTIERLFAVSQEVAVPRELYHTAISTFALAREQSLAQQVYSHMTQVEHMDPSAETFDALQQAFTRGWDMATAAHIFKEVRAANIPLHTVTANTLLRGFFVANQPQAAIDVYAYMVGRPTPLVDHWKFTDFLSSGLCDIHTFALVITGLVNASLAKEALIVFEDSFTVLPYVPRQLLETLVSSFEEKGLFDAAHLCWKRYRKRVEASQPPNMQVNEDDIAPNRLPLSYFGYLLGENSSNNL
ncbi:hypothetical protein H4R20_000782 [Coemansia guatemalensis]|uniref:Pentacotripeptide-repeat region of PRORP domain-containing protein n=1 Tax=Coemansia guatemalensis TaxID=2761395 RepID=A0A9W8LVI8_9FUNG|nr:hypothetical protein H4R20_000782 [Coemansia guatemalensis]